MVRGYDCATSALSHMRTAIGVCMTKEDEREREKNGRVKEVKGGTGKQETGRGEGWRGSKGAIDRKGIWMDKEQESKRGECRRNEGWRDRGREQEMRGREVCTQIPLNVPKHL